MGNKKIKLFTAGIITLIIMLAVGVRFYAFWKIREKIVEHLEQMKSDGASVRYEKLEVSGWSKDIHVTGLEIIFSGDSSCGSSVSIPDLLVENIDIIPMIFSRKLSVGGIVIKKPFFHRGTAIREKKEEENPGKEKDMLEAIEVGEIRIDSGTWENVDSANCAVHLRANLDFGIRDLTVFKPGHDSMKWKVASATASAITLTYPTRLYRFNIKEIKYTSADKLITLDSLKLEPTADRLEFAKARGRQIDQFTCQLPALEIHGVDVGSKFKQSFSATYAAMSFNLYAYRDKRFPLVKRKPRVLPMTFFRQLPYSLHIDSIRILPSNITYEEFPEGGTETGKVHFRNVEASIYNITNDSTQDARMTTTARFMNSGDLRAEFMFPGDRKKAYTARGSLTGFSMPEINEILIPVGSVKIESGRLNSMRFQFQYNDFRSEGKLEINYHDLKVLSLKKDGLRSPNKIVSLIIGIFVKKDIDGADTKEDRTGDILWERDPQKGILNYWWKSILSGLKAVYSLDKLTGNGKKQNGK